MLTVVLKKDTSGDLLGSSQAIFGNLIKKALYCLTPHTMWKEVMPRFLQQLQLLKQWLLRSGDLLPPWTHI